MDNQPSYSFGTKINTEKVDQIPGPGAYKTEQVKLDSTPAFTFGTKSELKKRNDTPGRILTYFLTNFSKKMYTSNIINDEVIL